MATHTAHTGSFKTEIKQLSHKKENANSGKLPSCCLEGVEIDGWSMEVLEELSSLTSINSKSVVKALQTNKHL